MRRAFLLVGLTLAAAPAAADQTHAHDHDHDHAEERRELGAHVHGEGALTIAIEGGAVAMMLEVPGADIVGFERPAATDADRAAVEAAKARLADPLSLFVVPAAAGCAVEAASVKLIGEGGEGDGHDHGHAHDHGHDHDAAAEGGHTEFHAEYALTCADPGALNSMTFAYFEAFPNAQRLDVAVATATGETIFDVERSTPSVTFDGGV